MTDEGHQSSVARQGRLVYNNTILRGPEQTRDLLFFQIGEMGRKNIF